MRDFLLQVLILFCCINSAVGQKKPLDLEALQRWPELSCEGISNNGRYFSYVVDEPKAGRKLIVEAINRRWRKEIKGIRDNGSFTANSQHFIFFSHTADSIGILQLGGDSIRYFEHVSEFKTPELGEGRWLACKLKYSDELLIVDLQTDRMIRVSEVENYLFDEQGKTIVLVKNVKTDSTIQEEVVWLDLASGKSNIIGHAYGISELMLDNQGSGLVFLGSRTGKGQQRALYYFNEAMDSIEIVHLDSNLANEGFGLVKISCFDKGGRKLFVYVQKQLATLGKAAVAVDIRSYNDADIRAERETRPQMAVIHLTEGYRFVLLQRTGDNYFCKLNEGDNFQSAMVVQPAAGTGYNERLENVFLVSVKDGTRRVVARSLAEDDLSFSLGGKYVTWYDKKKCQWYSYDILHEIAKSITDRINEPLFYPRSIPRDPSPLGIAGWLERDEAVLVYSRYDIWRVDPKAQKNPINLSGGYGRENGIELRMLDFHREQSLPIKWSDTLLLLGFDFGKKYNIFFSLSLAERGRVRELRNDGKVYYYSFSIDFPSVSSRFYPLKARDSTVYIARRMSPDEYANLYTTADFKSFRSLTDYQPQRDYNWYSTELVKWQKPDGGPGEGILFKPENFDSAKKYPVIFYYYERSSDALNLYIGAALSNGCMNIPWFVSNGYLVFVPNIGFENGQPGKAAYDAVVSAAKYLSKFKYIDSKHMGLQGHSYGGYETNYIISHANMFAAAATSSGVADLISDYANYSRQNYYEEGQGRVGGTLWQKRNLYIDNSPILCANRVNTPLLIMHNKKDPNVRFNQADEWFNALSRLGRKAWMLSYNDEGHTIRKRENQLDYSIRLSQFFGYYLKGEAAPKWMGKNILPEDKISTDALKLDVDASIP